ncbi:beta-ketoacyl-[acyl-carrier-protein] synthase family protein [Williamsia sterculiae]|nr:beta-ketoacyl-[acyl-carrier-protein] synthase family protein [Williamsia sterculiae]
MNTPVSITGVGAVSAFGCGVGTLVDAWTAGQSALSETGGSYDDFDPAAVISRSQIRRTDRYAQMALVACDEATAQAGWKQGLPYAGDRIGCVVATTASGADTVATELSMLNDKGEKAVAALRVMLSAPDSTAVLISMSLGLQGECYGMSGACAGGAMAIGQGVRMIRSGHADAVVVGGADAGSARLVRAMYRNLGAMSPTGRCRPFDVDRDGFLPGEGAAIMVLENAELARARQAPVLGSVLGYGSASDATHLTMPDQSGQERTVSSALADAGLEPEDIAYINAHGTGTRHNDVIETAALAAVLGKSGDDIPMSSVKSAIGHLQGAAGAIEAIATLEVLRRGVVAPTVGLRTPDPELSLHCLPSVATPLDPGCTSFAGLSNSFGLGGHNATLLLQAA